MRLVTVSISMGSSAMNTDARVLGRITSGNVTGVDACSGQKRATRHAAMIHAIKTHGCSIDHDSISRNNWLLQGGNIMREALIRCPFNSLECGGSDCPLWFGAQSCCSFAAIANLLDQIAAN